MRFNIILFSISTLWAEILNEVRLFRNLSLFLKQQDTFKKKYFEITFKIKSSFNHSIVFHLSCVAAADTIFHRDKVFIVLLVYSFIFVISIFLCFQNFDVIY